MRRHGRINFIGILLLLAVVLGGGWAWLFGPYYWDQQVMKEIGKSVALEWNGLGEHKARLRLEQQLRKRGLDDYIFPEDCKFNDRGPIKNLDCQWAVAVDYPLVHRSKTLVFSVTTDIGAGDTLTQY